MKGKGQPQTNHWAAPFSALVYGALCLEDERNREAYELGVQSLLRTAQTQGDDGSCPEGPEYAHRTTEGVFRAAWATAAVGDRRLAEQPFIARFKDWYLHTFMPGGYQVNAYDSRRYKIGSTPPLPLVLAMLMSVDGQSTWGVEHLSRGLARRSSGAGLWVPDDLRRCAARAAEALRLFPRRTDRHLAVRLEPGLGDGPLGARRHEGAMATSTATPGTSRSTTVPSSCFSTAVVASTPVRCPCPAEPKRPADTTCCKSALCRGRSTAMRRSLWPGWMPTGATFPSTQPRRTNT